MLEKLLENHENKQEVSNFCTYIEKLKKDSIDEKIEFAKRPTHIKNYTDEQLSQLFLRVANEWLVFDWIHITLQRTWVTYDYIAFKNKMLLVYPESTIDVQLVYSWDEIEFWKDSWKISYKHRIKNPFDERKDDDIIWAYAVVRNKRWEFLTTLNKVELDKHRKTAKTDFIWKAWFAEMCMKTIMKKACKTHFWDAFTGIEEMDNENYDVDNVNLDISWKDEVEAIKTLEELREYYFKNKGRWKEFDKLVNSKKQELWKSTT